MSPEDVKVTGKCDAGCGEDARYWYGDTPAATCGSSTCEDYMDELYRAHCEEMERKFRLEKELDEML